ncbi:unnamed protein product, partial [Pylaiella littoralis]
LEEGLPPVARARGPVVLRRRPEGVEVCGSRVSTQGRSFGGGDGPVPGRKGEDRRWTDEGAAVCWEQRGFYGRQEQPGCLRGVAGGGGGAAGRTEAVSGVRHRDRVGRRFQRRSDLLPRGLFVA